MKHINKTNILICIFLLAVFLRFQNLNWDANMHLHPDERFLTMVGNSMKLPDSLEDYLNAAVSTWNPTNIGFSFFVYGLFPLTLNKIIALFLNTDSYNALTLQGRLLSGIADMLVLFVVYKIGMLLKKKYHLPITFPLFSAFLYTIAVYPIQASHFYTTDTFLNLFLFTSLYMAVKYFYESKLSYFIGSSILLSLAISSKISAIYMMPLLMLIIFIRFLYERKIKSLVLFIVLYVLVLYVGIRFFSPYYFDSGDILNFDLNKQFVKNITELKYITSEQMMFPPNVQWLSKKPILFSLFNVSFFGLGIFSFILSFIGSIFFVRVCINKLRIKKSKYLLECLIGISVMIWIFGYFTYNSFQFAKSIRYLIFLFPFFALLGSFAFTLIRIKNRMVFLIVITGFLCWPLVFSSIYVLPNTRIAASYWIYNNISNNSLILSEYWDDSLPYPVSSEKQYRIEQMKVFDPDTDEKWVEMKKQLQKADYYILSSNRGWASMSTVPEKYPKMSKYYIDLFNEKTNYTLVKRFIPLYQYFFPFHPNSWINYWFEEAFTVYDHPSVFIFKNKK